MTEEFQKRWPHLVFSVRHKGMFFAQYGERHPGMGLNFKDLNEKTIEVLDEAEDKVSKELELAARWPYLWFSVNDINTHVWITRIYEGVPRDGATTGFSFSLLNLAYQSAITEKLDRLNTEGERANQLGWFFCTRCSIAKPPEEYAYFYFASQYCQRCKEEQPEHYKTAMAEDYR